MVRVTLRYVKQDADEYRVMLDDRCVGIVYQTGAGWRADVDEAIRAARPALWPSYWWSAHDVPTRDNAARLLLERVMATDRVTDATTINPARERLRAALRRAET